MRDQASAPKGAKRRIPELLTSGQPAPAVAYRRVRQPDDSDPCDPRPSTLKGRGTAVVIAHRYQRLTRTAVASVARSDWSGDDNDDNDGRAGRPAHDGVEGGRGAAPTTEVRIEQARRVVTSNDSPDVPFERSLNPYRGCEHGCIYCFARPTHAYLDLSPGLDFERIIVAKTNIAERLRVELSRPGYQCKPITLGAATDPYQPLERGLKLTRAALEVLASFKHPVGIVTKSALVERDIDCIATMAAEQLAAVMITITTLDGSLTRRLEPRATAPHRRLRAIETLAKAGIPVSLSVGPVIPFLTEPEIERIITAGAGAGARSVHYTIVRLPWEVAPLFEQWLTDHYPDRAQRVLARIREMRGGRRNDPRFGSRMQGEGVYAQLIRARVERAARAQGLTRQAVHLDCSRFLAPTASKPDRGTQLALF